MLSVVSLLFVDDRILRHHFTPLAFLALVKVRMATFFRGRAGLSVLRAVLACRRFVFVWLGDIIGLGCISWRSLWITGRIMRPYHSPLSTPG